MKKMRRNASADFGDEEAVLREVAEELGEDADNLSIDESHMTSFREGLVYEVSAGRRSWLVMESPEEAHALAVAVVLQDLETEPELFSKDFLAQHIDTDRLRRDLTSDVENMTYEDLREYDAEDFWAEADRYGMDTPEEDEDGDLPEPSDEQIVELAEAMTEDRLSDPMQYLEDMYGREEAVAQAIKIAGIDADAAAEDAVSQDGWEHFLSRYDGRSHETASGFVFWREN